MAIRPSSILDLLLPWAVLLLPSLAIGAGPPDLVRVRVPSGNVSTWFPPGTELRGLSVEQFEAMVASARSGPGRQSAPAAPRLLVARHFARWDPDSGLLLGRSELVVEPSAFGPSELLLSSWTPAIDADRTPPDDESPRVRSREDGRTLVRVDAAETSTITLPWQLRARPGSNGRGFTLGLPASEVAGLELDLPEDFIPEGPPGIRQGPEPGPDASRSTWRFAGRGGPIDLRLRARGEGRDPRRDARIWVSGPTRIDLLETSANWTMDWSVDAGPRGPRQFAIELDAGLDLIDVTGPGVEEYRTEAIDPSTRVTVRLTRDVVGPTTVSVRAVARVPSEGTWSIPAARPIDALWVGGTTSVRLNDSRILEGCRERSGRRIAPTPGEPIDPDLLVFETRAPLPVADLIFRKPWADVSAEVRGRLLLGSAAPRLEAQISWRVHRGHLLGLDVDLPPTWVPDRLGIVGLDEPPAWHPEVRPGGGIRVHVSPPASMSSSSPARGSLSMTVEATSTIAGGRGPLALPRVRPSSSRVRVGDELWVAWTDASTSLRPTSARGLAWIDPRRVLGASIAEEEEEGEGGLHEALAWRWNDDRGEARVDRERVENEPGGAVDLRAFVDRDRVRYAWQIAVDAGGESLSSIPIGIAIGGEASESSSAALEDLHFHDEATGLELARRPLDARRGVALGFPDASRSWELVLPQPRRGRVTLRSRLEQPWTGRGNVPLLALPGRFRARGTVVIEADRSVRTTVESDGLRVLDPAVAGRGLELAARPDPNEREVAGSVTHRLAHAFGYSAPDGRLVLRTENLELASHGGVIREAILTTSVHPQGASRHRLTLRIAAEKAQSLDLVMPKGAVLARARRDGQAVVPTRDARGLTIPLGTQHASRTFCTVTLDYQTDHDPGPSSGNPIARPECPTTSFPCLSFCWEIAAPEPWAPGAIAPGLVATDPGPSTAWPLSWPRPWPWPSGWSDPWRSLSGWFRRPAPGSGGDTRFAALDARVVATRPDEVTLGEWFTRWDSGASPLIIDRMSLASAGWGPKSRVVPPRPTRGPRGAALAALRPMGLTLVPIGGAFLITGQAEARGRLAEALANPGARAAWGGMLRGCVTEGSDASDRFQSVTHWRGEATPKVSIRGETSESGPLPEGWRSWRLVATDWPAAGTSVRLIDEHRSAAMAWASGLTVLLIGIAGRGLPVRRRAPPLAILLATPLLAPALRPDRDAIAIVLAGGLVGGLAVLFLWLGESIPIPIRVRGRSRGPRTRSPLTRLRDTGVTAGLLVATCTAPPGLAARRASAQLDPEAPIVALFPYDGPADPDRQPDRVILRWKDVERLQALAALDRARTPTGVRALAATHHVSWKDGRDVVVETELELLTGNGTDVDEGPSPSWAFPVGDAREINATLDGRAVPVLIRPEGRDASVMLDAREVDQRQRRGKRHRLRIRRIATPRRDVSGDLLRLPINPVASTRVVIEDAPDRKEVEVISARGRFEPRAPGEGGGVAGQLGPADRLEVRWSSGVEAAPGSPQGTVEGLLLWDAEPAGDRVRARLTFRKPGGTSAIRLKLEPGLVPRPGAIAGLVDATWRGTDDHPEWVACVDPPLPDGATIPIEFWRPAVVDPPADTSTPTRWLPRIEPLGVERYSGSLGFRRPAEWSGRLAAGPGYEPMTDEAFVKAMGNLADEPLTLAGTIRFPRIPTVSLATGPPAVPLLVEHELQMAIEPGRVAVELRANLASGSGRCDQVELELAEEFRIVAVTADGLSDWSRPAADRVRLRFDATFSNRREVKIQAWLPVASAPMGTGVARPEVDVPWPRWIDADARPMTLTIVSPTRFQVLPTTGLTPLVAPVAGPADPATGAPHRATYRVDQSEGPGRLSWDVEPARVGVLVESQLTVLPDFAEWVATLRYDVNGGALDVIHLKLPRAWAESAEVKVVGDGHQISAETRGANTYWMIRPEHPIWGSRRLIVRSAMPLPRAGELAFPDLIPLGRGTVDSYLSLINASGRELYPEGSPGLQTIVDEGRFRAAEFGGPHVVSPSVFHVRREGWTLKVQSAGEAEPGVPGAGPAHVSIADLACAIRPDGSVVGQACYEVEPRSGLFLTIVPPVRSEPLWASVNNIPAPPLRGASGRWMVPLGEESTRPVQVRLIWRSARDAFDGMTNAGAQGNGSRHLPLPALDQDRVPTLVTVSAPTTIEVRSPNVKFARVPRERIEIARVEWQGRRIAETLGNLDRGSRRDCEALISALVQFELQLRDAERSSLWNETSPAAYREARILRLQERGRIARAALADAVKNAALDEFDESARIHLGLIDDDPDSSTLEIPEPGANVRIRRLGLPRYFQGESAGAGGPPSLEWTRVTQPAALDRPWDRAVVVLAVIAAAVAVGFVVRTAPRVRRLGPALLATALVTVAVAAGPLAFAGGLAMSLLGRFGRVH